jgi:cyclophilin family peptidyl-prolyl cis-trans isomerase
VRRYALLAAGIALALLGTACGSASSSSATSASAPASSAASSAAAAAAPPATLPPLQTGSDGCDHTASSFVPTTQYATPPAPPFSGGRVVFETSCGTITIVLDPAVGGAVESAFAGLVAKGFYDGLSFHRVVPGFVLQGGDPTGTGGGGPGFSVTQAPPASYVYRDGDVAMAKTEAEAAGTAGSQFFIVSSAEGAANLGSPPLYAVVGHVVDAASKGTVARIDALGTGDGPPSSPVFILRARLVR